MISRETRIQAACVVAGLTALAALTSAGVTETLAGQVLALGLFYGLTFAGSHVHLALTGDGESVPVVGRWRFVGLVAASIVLVAIVLAARESPGGGRTVQTLAAWAFGLVVGYFVVEGIAGYRQSMQEP